MDWTIPNTFYPTVLPSVFMWALFLLTCVTWLMGILTITKLKGAKFAALLAIPLAVGLLAVSMVAGMVVTFFVHDQ